VTAVPDPARPVNDDVQLDDPLILYWTVKLVAAVEPVCADQLSWIALLEVALAVKPVT
jgi:hypothetical protein